jgi:ATP-dependent helicase/nuclease subunit A
MSGSALVDAEARTLIRERLDRNLLVEAAAGTGKTSELVARLCQVILQGRGRLRSIAALTFTEKAAGEMKLRIRTELERALFDPAQTAAGRERAQLALSEIETAKIATIHAFCADLLRVHPVEARVDPGFVVAETERMRGLLGRVFDRWFERVLADPPEGIRRILQRKRLDPSGPTARDQLLMAASSLVETRDFATPYRRPEFDRRAELQALHAELRALAALATQGRSGDPLASALADLERRLEQADEYAEDPDALEEWLRLLARDRTVWKERRGRGELYGTELARRDVLLRWQEAKQRLERCVRACEADLAACLSRELAAVVAAYEDEKTSEGMLDFFDLLLLTRRLLQDVPAVRAQAQAELSQLFVDEFQDTDPVQSEILLLLCADAPDESDPWRCQPRAGKLFVVGDPKQSIYRFRRADIALYERVKQHLLERGALLVSLSTSFRALPGIQACVNAAFAAAMGGGDESGQASYVPLASHRPARAGQPALIALPVPAPYGMRGRITKWAIDACLPDAVAALIDWLVQTSGYVVAEAGREVPLSARHVCLLFRRFRNFGKDVTRDYVRALEARRLPHVLSGGRSFHAREEVSAIRSTLLALEWPDDTLHVYATLRGPLVAFSDETLLRFKTRFGHLHPLRPVPPEALRLLDPEEQALAQVLDQLGRLHLGRNREPIATSLTRWLDFLRAHAGIAIWPTGEQALGNVLRLIDFARSYERRGGASSFRGFVEWLDEQARAGQTAEASVIEESSDGVRIMTVHAAKGLEFPVVVLCDPTAPARPEYASRFIDPVRKLWAQSLCNAEPIELTEQRELVRTHDAAEIVRLAYVAATRARELLIVPTCADEQIAGWLEVLTPALYPPPACSRQPQTPSVALPDFGDDGMLSSARIEPMPAHSVAPGEHLPQQGEQRVVWWDPNLLALERGASGGVAHFDLLRADTEGQRDAAGLAAYQRWRSARAETRERGAQPSLTSKSITQAAHLQPSAASGGLLVLDARAAGARPSGPRFGSLVHKLLEHVDFAAPALEPLAAALSRALGASELEQTAAIASVRTALQHEFFGRVRAAALRGELYRETSTLLRAADGELLDGVVDLAFRESNAGGARLVVVDFKTDVVLNDLAAYEVQLGLYAEALRAALGLPVQTVLLRV